MDKSAPTDMPRDARTALTALYWAAVQAVAPGPALRAVLERIPVSDRGRRVWILAIGKAAHPMAATAATVLAEWNRAPAGGVIVAPNDAASPHPTVDVRVGDHPVPGARSLEAAARIAAMASRVREGDDVWVLLSGGATSLTAAPEGHIRPDELFELYDRLLGAGLDIAQMNLIRKRFSRWGAGRLAVALAPARVRNYIVSDVIGDDLAAIGSGPCVPDPSTAAQIHQMLDAAGLWAELPLSMKRSVNGAERDPSLETPKAGDAAFAHVERRIIASNRVALEAIEARALAFGYEPRVLGTALAGEAAVVGRRLIATLGSYCGADATSLSGRTGRTCLIWGGETTVTLGREHGRGGRCQEMALSAARELAATAGMSEAALLAAGTDGRDGDTDAAGAIVTRDTWRTIERAGREPVRDLERHDSYASLDAADALLRTELTSTNVMDVVIAVCGPPVLERRARLTPAVAFEAIAGSLRRLKE
ncbi:MAG TPA: DUF4147 domain-containing protein [Gemmatimonadaceae bacterium]